MQTTQLCGPLYGHLHPPITTPYAKHTDSDTIMKLINPASNKVICPQKVFTLMLYMRTL